MERDTYGMLLDTIKITLDCLAAETQEFNPQLGPIRQSIWNGKEQDQIKAQLKGLLALVPNPSYFNQG